MNIAQMHFHFFLIFLISNYGYLKVNFLGTENLRYQEFVMNFDLEISRVDYLNLLSAGTCVSAPREKTDLGVVIHSTP